MAHTHNFRTSFHSGSHSQLLDVIDRLRSLGISNDVPLPQIIVCGDQSSGKSSVLEAMSGIRFPMKENLCTRFATELILRRGKVPSATAAIVPGSERSEQEKKKISGFQAPAVQLEDFPSLIDSARDAIGIDAETKAFSDDVLRVEISGPEQPHLTLVDLPGVIHAENKQQSSDDVELVQTLVRKYMNSSRSIILAVISAKNDYANQIVTKLAREFDPQGTRTLGIITKPDTLHAGSESEKSFINLAKNEDVVFRLGWHVLRNRDFDSRSCTIEERNEKEKEFFAQGAWKSLSSDVIGIESLKPRLSSILKDHITGELPNLVRDIQSALNDCNAKLLNLGEPRTSVHEERRYLISTSQSFTILVRSAVNGTHDDTSNFFGDARTKAGFEKRLRAVVQDILSQFAEDMRNKGEYERIVDNTNMSKDKISRREIARSEYLENVKELMKRNRGCELSGTFNPMIVGDLFHQQSKPWTGIVEEAAQKVVKACEIFIIHALYDTVEGTAGNEIIRQVIGPVMRKLLTELKEKISEIMAPHRTGNPLTYNHYFTDTIQNARRVHQEKRLAKTLDKISSSGKHPPTLDSNTIGSIISSFHANSEADMRLFASMEALEYMTAYYKVAMKLVIDNIASLGIEQCLLRKLPDLFTPEKVASLDDETISSIAAEPNASKERRKRIKDKVQSLEQGLQALASVAPTDGLNASVQLVEGFGQNGNTSGSPEQTALLVASPVVMNSRKKMQIGKKSDQLLPFLATFYSTNESNS
ncbi:dynamin family protein [Phyllosticta citriasiana]|uniref:dynamin family protein n=1 Tax=Phyllosticta citriasiana TaxID=595635 RepID=UPI0030FDE730